MKDTKSTPPTRTYKVWIEVEEVDEWGDQVAEIDLPFPSTTVFANEASAVAFAVKLNATAEQLLANEKHEAALSRLYARMFDAGREGVGGADVSEAIHGVACDTLVEAKDDLGDDCLEFSHDEEAEAVQRFKAGFWESCSSDIKQALRRLLSSPDLNLQSLEEETLAAIEEAERALK